MIRLLHRVSKAFRDVGLFWKLLVPFAALLLVVGVVGSYVIVHDLAVRAQTALDQRASQQSAVAVASLHESELYLVESGEVGANLQGMAEAVAAHDVNRVSQLMLSVLALKPDITLLAVTDPSGQGIAQFTKTGQSPVSEPPASWQGSPLVAPALAGPGDTTGSFLGFGDRPLIALATSVCSQPQTCAPVGAVVVGVDARRVAPGLVPRAAGAASGVSGVALFDSANRAFASWGHGPSELPRDAVGRRLRRRVGAAETVYVPATLQSRRVGTIAVAVPTGSALTAVRQAGLRLALLLVLAMAGIVAVGYLLSRFLLGQVRPLLAVNSALAEGDLTARVPVLGHDELGELAVGVNNMAGALEESYAHLEAKVEERTAEVQRLLQERTDFFTAVSHEFRTPLAVILGQARMLGDGDVEKKAAWHAQAASVLTEAGTQLLDFVNEILEIAKLESGRTRLDLEAVDAAPLLRGLKPTIETLAADHDLGVTVRVGRGLPTVWAEEARLRQVVLGLVDNAVKYTPPGGKVSLRAKAGGDGLVIEIADTGIGIPEDAVGRLFEPFYRVQGNETQDGQPSSGLGLALIKGLVDAMSGTIGVESAVGRGTIFTVRFPSAAVPAAPSATASGG